MNNYFVSWFYAETKDDDNFAPSIGARTGTEEAQALYWRCIYNLYQTAIWTNRDVIDQYFFFTNMKKLPSVNGVNMDTFFKEHKIEVVNLELTRKMPKDWSGEWRNQLYIFDILEYLKNIEGNFVILDSDCVITQPLGNLFQEIEKHGIITLTIDYPVERSINGCSINEMRDIYQECFGTYPEQLVYSGGEICAISSAFIGKLLDSFEAIWRVNYRRYENKLVKLTEEAHILSVIYYYLGCQNNIGRKYTKRMWTDLKCDTVEPADAKLPIWHLPAEKKFGLQNLFFALKGKQQISSQQVMKLCDRKIWISKPGFMRKIRWYYRYGMKK